MGFWAFDDAQTGVIFAAQTIGCVEQREFVEVDFAAGYGAGYGSMNITGVPGFKILAA